MKPRTPAALLLTCLPASLPAAFIVLDEIHYAPPDKTRPEEIVELYNNGPVAVDLSGWYFSGGIDFTFPPGTALGAGEYLVVAQDLDAFRARFGNVRAVGPFSGRLSNDGERLVLRNRNGGREDEVDYRRGFPWPTVGDPEGYSIELIHPDLDNSLGGSWRASNPSQQGESTTLVASGGAWKYKLGTAEASTPASAWREPAFDDGAWPAGNGPVGYGEPFIATALTDMQGSYSSFFLRKELQVSSPADVGGLVLEALYDDGFNAWVNGVNVASVNVPSKEVAYNGLASTTREDGEYKPIPLPSPAGYLVAGRNVLAVQVHNISLASSSDAFFDARLTVSTGAGAGPTPGARNSVHATDAPPQLRGVEHAPRQPVSGVPVLVTVKATDPDGVAKVTLEHQVVDPGAYVALTDPEYAQGWTQVPMNDEGLDGDAAAGDDTFSCLIPASVQEHRRLVRYRLAAEDYNGESVRVPYGDDPQPNFAYFVHDGVPSWAGAIEPGSTNAARRQVVEYPPEVMGSLPVYHLITKRASAEDATWFSKYGGDNYLWIGTLVRDGEVYDHIRYRARGGVWRYAMGKNMWKLDFLRGHGLKVLDDFGREQKTRWDKLNFSACIQQGDYLHRGEQGMFEAAGFKLFRLAGVPACTTHFCTFRIVDEVDETGPTQYAGDFWGLYLAMEQPDGRFLEEHGLPDGNFYKMEGGTGELNNLGPAGPTDKSDLNAFLSTYQGTTPPDDWWRDSVDLATYYSYRSIVEAIHHGDVGYGKNYFYYLDPETAQWSQLPWDLDLTWADNMFGDGNSPFKSRVLTRAAFSLEYKNRLREIRDLLYNPDQTGKLLDELAARIDDPSGGPSIVDADRAQWDYNPVMTSSSIVNLSKAGKGRFYQQAATKDFPGMVALMKSYVSTRGAWIDSNIASDSAIPRRPTVTYAGPAGYPLDALRFRASAFSDPQGDGTFGAMRWRAAEVTSAGAPPFDPASPRAFEIDAAWESAEIAPFQAEVTIPATALVAGRTYRVRVRMKDSTGRWSNWSQPAELVAGSPAAPFPQEAYLRVTEVMYHPEGDLDEEFVEVLNTGPSPLDLSAVRFTGGIEFDFGRSSSIRTLAAGEYAVLVQNPVAFRARYGTGIPVAGEYEDRLSNGGERVVLAVGAATTVLDFTFDDSWYPLTDGGGRSLEIVDPAAPAGTWSSASSWRESAAGGGTPGAPPSGTPGGRQLPSDANQDGFVDHSDAVSLLLGLFAGGGRPPPCEGTIGEGGNLALLDASGDGALGVTDAVAVLGYLFREGPAPARGTSCVRILGCPEGCGG
ncbi:MAG: lamin tail domain-containing protein [Planctomycetes bacterium]|nr:lamin tail domain-containing protein [Planctomycetota bacterium]